MVTQDFSNRTVSKPTSHYQALYQPLGGPHKGSPPLLQCARSRRTIVYGSQPRFLPLGLRIFTIGLAFEAMEGILAAFVIRNVNTGPTGSKARGWSSRRHSSAQLPSCRASQLLYRAIAR